MASSTAPSSPGLSPAAAGSSFYTVGMSGLGTDLSVTGGPADDLLAEIHLDGVFDLLSSQRTLLRQKSERRLRLLARHESFTKARDSLEGGEDAAAAPLPAALPKRRRSDDSTGAAAAASPDDAAAAAAAQDEGRTPKRARPGITPAQFLASSGVGFGHVGRPRALAAGPAPAIDGDGLQFLNDGGIPHRDQSRAPTADMYASTLNSSPAGAAAGAASAAAAAAAAAADQVPASRRPLFAGRESFSREAAEAAARKAEEAATVAARAEAEAARARAAAKDAARVATAAAAAAATAPSSSSVPGAPPQPQRSLSNDTASSYNSTYLRATAGSESFQEHLAGQYRITQYLGHGAYGHVFKATHVASGDTVAIKRVADIFADATHSKRLLRELRILRMLSHENIIEFREILAPPSLSSFSSLFIVFEFVDTDLQKLINSNQHFSNLHIKFFIHQILVGLMYMHSANVIHRDLKPANLLVNADCSVKICDFGLARGAHLDAKAGSSGTPPADRTFLPPTDGGALLMSPSSSSSASSSSSSSSSSSAAPAADAANNNGNSDSSSSKNNNTNVLPMPRLVRQLTRHVVTRWYRAPELILLRNDYTAAIDIWSAGCILAELLSMQAESVPLPKDRGALFPGRSCYPLTAPTKESYKDRRDQLNVIFDIIGTPSAADIRRCPPQAQKYLGALPHKPKADLSKLYEGADPQAVDLLYRMLRFLPEDRITAADAIKHPFLEEVRNPHTEGDAAARPIDFEFEDVDITEARIRELIVAEIVHFHPELMQSHPELVSLIH